MSDAFKIALIRAAIGSVIMAGVQFFTTYGQSMNLKIAGIAAGVGLFTYLLTRGGLEGWLDLEGVAERGEHRPDPILLGLGLVARWGEGGVQIAQVGQRPRRVRSPGIPLRPLRQQHVEEVVAEEVLVAVGADGQRRLVGRHGRQRGGNE